MGWPDVQPVGTPHCNWLVSQACCALAMPVIHSPIRARARMPTMRCSFISSSFHEFGFAIRSMRATYPVAHGVLECACQDADQDQQRFFDAGRKVLVTQRQPDERGD